MTKKGRIYINESVNYGDNWYIYVGRTKRLVFSTHGEVIEGKVLIG